MYFFFHYDGTFNFFTLSVCFFNYYVEVLVLGHFVSLKLLNTYVFVTGIHYLELESMFRRKIVFVLGFHVLNRKIIV